MHRGSSHASLRGSRKIYRGAVDSVTLQPVSAGGGAWTGDAWLNPELGPASGRVEGYVFNDAANIGEVISDLTARFPDYLYTTGCTIDSSVQYQGQNTLKIVEGESTTAEKFFECSNYAGLGATSEMSWQVLMKLPATFHTNRNRILFGAGGEANFGGEYRTTLWNLNRDEDPEDPGFPDVGHLEKWASIQPDAFTTLAALKALDFFAVTTRLRMSGADLIQTIYLNDSLLGTYTNGTGANLSMLDMDIDCLCLNGTTPDPTNNFLSVVRVEWRTDNHWGLW